jgi:excisionase family DNA binding protein
MTNFITVAELARDMQVGLSTVYRWINEYDLPCYCGPSARFKIDPDDFQRWYRQFRQIGNRRFQKLPYERG